MSRVPTLHALFASSKGGGGGGGGGGKMLTRGEEMPPQMKPCFYSHALDQYRHHTITIVIGSFPGPRPAFQPYCKQQEAG